MSKKSNLLPQKTQAEYQAYNQRNAEIDKLKNALAGSLSKNQQIAEGIERSTAEAAERNKNLELLINKAIKKPYPKEPTKSNTQPILENLEETTNISPPPPPTQEQLQETAAKKETEPTISLPSAPQTFGQSPVVAQQLTAPFGRQTPELLRGVSFKYDNNKYKLYPQISNQQGEPLTFQEDQLDSCSDENCYTFTPRTDESLLAKYFLSLFFSNKYTEIKAVLDNDAIINKSEYQKKISEIRELINKELIDYALNTDTEIQDVDAKRNYGKKLTFTVASIFYAMENDINVTHSERSGQRRLLDRSEIYMILRNLFKKEIFKGDINKDGETRALVEQILNIYIGQGSSGSQLLTQKVTSSPDEFGEALRIGEGEGRGEEKKVDEEKNKDESELSWINFLPPNLNFKDYDFNNENNKKAFDKLKEIINNYENAKGEDFNKYFDITQLPEPIVTISEIKQAFTEKKEEGDLDKDSEEEGDLDKNGKEKEEKEEEEVNGPAEESEDIEHIEDNYEGTGGQYGGAVIYSENIKNLNNQIFLVKYKNSIKFVVPIEDQKKKQIIIIFDYFYDIQTTKPILNRYVDFVDKIKDFEQVVWYSINVKPELIEKSEQLNGDEISKQLQELGEQKKKLSEGFTGTRGAVKPRSSVDVAKSMDDELIEKEPQQQQQLQQVEELKRELAAKKQNVENNLKALFSTKDNDTKKNEILKILNKDQEEIVYDTLKERSDKLSEDEQAFMDYYKIKNIQSIYNLSNDDEKEDILHLLYDYGEYAGSPTYKERRNAVMIKYVINEEEISQIQNEFYTNNTNLQNKIVYEMGPVKFTPPIVGGNKLTKTYRNFPKKKSIPFFNTRRNLDSVTHTPLKLYTHLNKKRFTRNKKRAHKKTQRAP